TAAKNRKVQTNLLARALCWLECARSVPDLERTTTFVTEPRSLLWISCRTSFGPLAQKLREHADFYRLPEHPTGNKVFVSHQGVITFASCSGNLVMPELWRWT